LGLGVGFGARTLKQASLHAIKSLGGFHLLLDSAWRRKRLLILCYHGVSLADEHEWNPSLYMPPAALARRLEMLRTSRCAVLPLGDALQRLYGGTLPARSVVVTFDDGYFDFYEQAHPLLRRFDIPATVYLTTLRCGNSSPIFRLVCAYLLWRARGRVVHVENGLNGESLAWDLRSDRGRAGALRAVIAESERAALDIDGKHRLAARLASWLGIDYEEIGRKRMLTIMTPDEVRKLAAAGVDFQLHTHSHNTPSESDRFGREIAVNRDVIETMTGRRATHFCYPSGAYRPEFLPWLAGAEVVSATTCDPWLASNRTNPLLLPRFVDGSGRSAVEFEGWVSGAATLLSKHRSYAHATD
jgi:peptidoglycan/xylan/chitin deacetylase (PgdA/CDA1 family)